MNLPPLRKRAVPLSQSAVLRYLRKGDDLNLDGAGNAARLHLAVKHYGVVPGLGQKLHLGLKQAVQAGVGVLFAAYNAVQYLIGAVAVVKAYRIGRNIQPGIPDKLFDLIHSTPQ